MIPARRSETEARLETLLHAYAVERADDTQAVTSIIALLTASIGLITVIGFALINHDQIQSWLIALAPVAPLPFIAYGALITHVAQIRGRVIDRYEREIRRLTSASGGGRSYVPYGHEILDRMVWEAPFSRILLGLSFISFFVGYLIVVSACFIYSKDDVFRLALTVLIFVCISTATLIALFFMTLFPDYWLDRGLGRIVDDD